MNRNTKTLSNALRYLSESSYNASKSIAYLIKSIDDMPFKLTRKGCLKGPLKFISPPTHKVSIRTIKQLKLILRGRSSIRSKVLPFPSKSNKVAKKAFKSDGVIWNTEANGLDYLKSLYNQTKI